MTTLNRKRVDYELLQSNLPYYLRVVENGSLSVSGMIQILDTRTPVWVTEEGNIGRLVEEASDVSIELSAQPSEYGTTITYTVGPDFGRRGGTLPFGLHLDRETGIISGEVTRNMVNTSDPVPFYNDEVPIWSTEDQQWSLNSLDDFSLQFEANAIDPELSLAYYIVDGGLPFGLHLNTDTGELSGNLALVLTNDGYEIPEIVPKPRWLSPPGRIARKGEQETFEFTLEAIPQLGETITYEVIKGGLPFGMRLDLTTGTIYGDTAEVYYPELPVVLDRNAPIFMMEPDLGRVSAGDEVSIEILTRAFDNRTITSYAVYRDKSSGHTLPFGLVLSKEGVITGTVSEDNIPGLYRFTIVITDSAGLKSCNIFDMQVVGSEGGRL